MTAFLLNLILAGAWAALVGEVDTPHLVVGFLLGYAILWFLRPLLGEEYHRKLPMLVGFVGFFLRELVLSTLRVAWEVVTPDRKRRPGIVEVPLEELTEIEIVVLANLITLTPGTLSIDVSSDRRSLYVHAMFVDDAGSLRRSIKEGFEGRVMRLSRPAARPERGGP